MLGIFCVLWKSNTAFNPQTMTANANACSTKCTIFTMNLFSCLNILYTIMAGGREKKVIHLLNIFQWYMYRAKMRMYSIIRMFTQGLEGEGGWGVMIQHSHSFLYKNPILIHYFLFINVCHLVPSLLCLILSNPASQEQ